MLIFASLDQQHIWWSFRLNVLNLVMSLLSKYENITVRLCPIQLISRKSLETHLTSWIYQTFHFIEYFTGPCNATFKDVPLKCLLNYVFTTGFLSVHLSGISQWCRGPCHSLFTLDSKFLTTAATCTHTNINTHISCPHITSSDIST